MKAVRHIKTLALVGVLSAAFWAFAAPSTSVYAESEEATPTIEITTDSPVSSDAEVGVEAQSAAADTTVTYDYVAQPGDSYTKMARKALQTYGAKYNASISAAKIIFAETNMTIAAGSPHLEVGQKVSIKESDVKSWFEKGVALDAAAEALWNYYVQFVDFNTDRVGQAS